jgi:nicotinamide riboside transporter PnuC
MLTMLTIVGSAVNALVTGIITLPVTIITTILNPMEIIGTILGILPF